MLNIGRCWSVLPRQVWINILCDPQWFILIPHGNLYRFRNDARPVQPADPIRLQLAGRLFSHGVVRTVLCRPAHRPGKAAVPVVLRKIFRNLANDFWLLEPEVVFQWGRFYFRGQPLYRGRLSARIHFVISRSGVRVTPPAPEMTGNRKISGRFLCTF